MRSRRYTKRGEIWGVTRVPDGFGGYTMEEALITTSWMETVTNTGSRLTDIGITDPTKAVIFRFRHRNDVDYSALEHFIMYRGQKYIVQNFPVNKDLRDVDIEIIGIKEQS